MAKSSESYSQILKSSSIIGGAQGIQYITSLVRQKAVAVLLGTSGAGLITNYQALLNFLTNVVALGMGPSGVRQIADAHSRGEEQRAAGMVIVIRRICWVTGLLGWAMTAAMAAPISGWTFGDQKQADSILWIGAALVFSSASAGQMATLQGFRRLKDLALVNVLAVFVSTLICIPIYYIAGVRGIIPVFILTAAITWALAAWRVRGIELQTVVMTWGQTFRQSGRLVSLGLAFMWSAVVTSAAELALKSMVTRELGDGATGLYGAAWSISGMFALFIINAMGADFYPRLTASIADRKEASELVNQQTEIGILLALPGLVGTLAFAPWLILILNTREFLEAADLLPWFVVGLLFRIVSWPMGYIMLAQGASRWFVVTETLFAGMHVALGFAAVERIGLQGVGLAFAGMYALYTLGMRGLSRHLIGLRWSAGVWKLMLVAGVFVGLGYGAERIESEWISIGVGVVLTGLAGVFSLRGIAERLGKEHRWIQMAFRIPGMNWLLGSRTR